MWSTWFKIFAQLANAILTAGSIGIAKACGADDNTAVAIGTIIGTTTGNAVGGIVDVTTKQSDSVIKINEYYRGN